jgi:hypothetical protein
MKFILPILLMMLFVSLAVAETTEDNGSRSTVDFILSLNPFILIIAGILLFFAANLAKFIGIALALIGVVSLVLSIL